MGQAAPTSSRFPLLARLRLSGKVLDQMKNIDAILVAILPIAIAAFGLYSVFHGSW